MGIQIVCSVRWRYAAGMRWCIVYLLSNARVERPALPHQARPGVSSPVCDPGRPFFGLRRSIVPHIHFHARLDRFFGMDKQHPGDILTYVFLTASFTNQRWHLLKDQGSCGALRVTVAVPG